MVLNLPITLKCYPEVHSLGVAVFLVSINSQPHLNLNTGRTMLASIDNLDSVRPHSGSPMLVCSYIVCVGHLAKYFEYV